MTRTRLAGVIIASSGMVTLFLAAVLGIFLFVLVLLPMAIGSFQTLTGIRMITRGAAPRRPVVAAAGIGLVVGALHAPGNMFNPAGDEPIRLLIGVALLMANAIVIVLLVSGRIEGKPVMPPLPPRDASV